MRIAIFAGLVLCSLIAGVLLSLGYVFMPEPVAPTPVVLETPVVDTKEAFLNASVVDWVYSKSTRISKRMAQEIVNETYKEAVQPLLVLALFQAESEFFPGAVSSANAIGLGQIIWKHWEKPLVAKGICKERRDLFDIQTNIQATVFILNALMKEHKGDIHKVLNAYLGASNKTYKDKIVYNFVELSLQKGVRI